MTRLVHRDAQLELVDAFEYYRQKSPAIARTFRAEADNALERMDLFPESGQVIHDLGVRRNSLKTYPYHIVYILDPDGLYVLAFAHSRRDPDYWLYRLGL